MQLGRIKKIHKKTYGIFSLIVLLSTLIFVFVNYNTSTYAEAVFSLWDEERVELGDVISPDSSTTIVDADGYTFTAWEENTTSIRMQKFDIDGNKLWGANGINLPFAGSTYPDSASDQPGIISDGNGGIIITWFSLNSSPPFLYTQKIDADGVPQWTTNGVAVTNDGEMNSQGYHKTISDGNGGVIIMWSETSTIYMQRVDSSGARQWGNSGLSIASTYYSYLDLIGDSSGNAYVSWVDPDLSRIMVQKVDVGGNKLWGTGVYVIDSTQANALALDQQGGVYVFSNLELNRVNSSGTAVWTTGGMSVDPLITSTYSGPPKTRGWSILSDSEGSLYVMGYNSGESAIVIDKLDSLGVSLWSEPTLIEDTTIDYYGRMVIQDDDIVLSWYTDSKIVAQKVSSTGQIVWDSPVLIEDDPNSIYTGTMNELPGGILIGSSINNKLYLYTIHSLYEIESLDSSIDVLDTDGNTIRNYGLIGTNTLHLKDFTSEAIVAEITVNAVSDMNWSSVIGITDFETSKTYASISDGVGVESYKLYVPVGHSSNSHVRICPSATNLEEVGVECANGVNLEENQTAVVGNDNITTSKTTIGGIEYWELSGITAGGAISLSIEVIDTPPEEGEDTIVDVLEYRYNQIYRIRQIPAELVVIEKPKPIETPISYPIPISEENTVKTTDIKIRKKYINTNPVVTFIDRASAVNTPYGASLRIAALIIILFALVLPFIYSLLMKIKRKESQATVLAEA